MFGLGVLKGSLIGLAGGIVIGLAIKETCKLIDSKKKNTQKTDTNENLADNINWNQFFYLFQFLYQFLNKLYCDLAKPFWLSVSLSVGLKCNL